MGSDPRVNSAGSGSEDGEQPRSYMGLSIICTLLCFPTAIISIRESMACERFLNQGRTDLAKLASQKARKWLWYSTVLGVMSLLILLLAVYLLWPLITDGLFIIKDRILGEPKSFY